MLATDIVSGERMGGSLAGLVAAYRRQLLREEKSLSTVRSYSWGLKDFATFLASRGCLDGNQVTRDLVEEWQDSTREHMGPRSRSLAAAAVRGFLKWGIDRDAFNPKAPYWLARVKVKPGRPRPLPHEEAIKLIAHLQREARYENPTQLRDRALFLYLLATGARVSEALQVTRAAYARALVIQKGGTEKELLAPPFVVAAIEAYVEHRIDGLPWLWVTLETEPVRPLTPAGVREIWRRLAKRAGVHPFTTHQLRHTNATELLDAGVPAPAIAEQLGHHDLSTLKNYGQVTVKQRQVAVDAMQRFIETAADPEARSVFLPRVLPRLTRKSHPKTPSS